MDIVPQLIANAVIAGSFYAILSIGFNLIFSVGKFIDIGYGVMTVIGGYSVFYASKMLGLPLAAGTLLGLLISGFASYFAYRLIYRPLKARKASSAVLLIASLGLITAIQALIAILFTSQFQSLSQLISYNPVTAVLGASLTLLQAVVFVIAFLLFGGVALFLRRTRFGKAVVAISDDEEVSKIVGINTERIIGRIFFIGGAIGGLGGILIGIDTGLEPIMGLPWLLVTVTAAIIGGIGNIYGGIVGAFLLAFAENFGIWLIPGEWKNAIAFTLLLAFLLWRPRGLFPR